MPSGDYKQPIQEQLDEDFKIILNAHLITRQDLLKRVRSELAALSGQTRDGVWVVVWSDVMALMDRLISEAKLP